MSSRDQDDNKLGYPLCRKGRNWGMIIVGIILLVLSSWCATAIYSEQLIEERIAGAGLCLFFMPIAILMLRMGNRVLQLHEHGVANGATTLSFDEIESYTRVATNHELYGVPIRTNNKITFVPFEGNLRRKIVFVWQTRLKGDDEFELFHDTIVAAIAGRMRKQLEKTGVVGWISGVALLRDGLQMTERTGKQLLVPYHELELPKIKQGLTGTKLRISSRDSSKTLAKISLKTPNLFPVMELLESLIRPPVGSPTEWS